MGSIGRYIFRTTFGAFLLVLVSLTSAIWLTQALRDVDLMTGQGQTILTFVGITSLVIPQLIMVIAPVALVVAVSHILHKLATDSEIIVMNGAGMRPWGLLKPFIAVTIVASMMLTAISAFVAPESLRMLRRWISEVRADLVSNIVQPGRFTAIEQGLAFYIRERRPNGLLVGLLMDDRRDPAQRVTIIAERGEMVKNANGSFLLLEKGSIQRYEAKQRDPNIVVFDRYAFDLSQFSGGTQIVKYSVRERYLWQLIAPDTSEPLFKEQPGQFRAELHDRLLGPIYPFAFVLIAFAFLGAPRTTRQSAAWAITGVILAVSGLRLIGFASTVFALKYPIAVLVQYVAVAGAMAASLFAISRGLIIEPPAFLTRAVDAASEWLVRRAGTSVKPAQ
ncbi:MAG: lipopolysaccharide export system permease protein [Alphaproteobacteria bacterium]|nr:lipopolysaccharide export system permease protein [Alphaproteobacteria bacterium]